VNRSTLGLLLAIAIASRVGADVRLASIFGDGMVLQRESTVAVFGWGRPGEKVSVRGSWPAATPAEATVGTDRRWSAALATPAAGGPYSVTVAGDTTRRLDNVLIGEVWLCAGQSNMEWSVRQCKDGPAEAAAADFPAIRLFNVVNTVAAEPAGDCEGRWQTSTPATAGGFSASAYYFGRTLHRALGVPIGLIQSDWGGTRIEAWMSRAALAAFSECAKDFERLDAARDPDRRAALMLEATEGWWRRVAAAESKAGAAGWADAGLDDAAWPTLNQPAVWASDDLKSFDGLVYERRRFDVPAEWGGRAATISLGPIDDRDDTFINGAAVGGTRDDGQWNTPREYAVPAGVLRAGRNVLAVRVLDTGGGGGLCGQAEDLWIATEGAVPEARVSLAGEWRYRVGLKLAELPERGPSVHLGPNTVSGLYNGMIAPLATCGIRGVIWYQGESNRPNAERYGELLPAMIRQWRGEWGRGDFPFYFVQIAPYNYAGDNGETARLRESQSRTLAVAGTGMVVTMDIGDPADIHPADKQSVGQRLATLALARTYAATSAECSGPLYRGMSVSGGEVRVEFDHAAGLRTRDNGRPSHFEVAGADGVFHAADAAIAGTAVVVSSPQVQQPQAVRYGWCAACEPNLENGAGLPAAPFQSGARGAYLPTQNRP
jgi:sialate O-acetylesterase